MSPTSSVAQTRVRDHPTRTRSPARCAVQVTGVLWSGTLLGAAAVAAIPPLARAVRHVLPVHLDGSGVSHTIGGGAGIAANNLAIAGSMLLMAAIAPRVGRKARIVGDILAVSIVARSALLVGAVLGSRTTDLLPYLPHLPLEWAGIGTAAGAWLYARRRPLTARQLATFTAVTVALLLGAAVLETYATPR
jgi:uncharacterized membrane protein SpoIIM required for sporulation